VANHADTTITLTDAPDEDERAVIMDGLRAYNDCAGDLPSTKLPAANWKVRARV
jgi:hypothetical protein